MKFIKMHGSSNDYVYVNGFASDFAGVDAIIPHIPAISDRHRGVGSDGLVFILPSDTCDLRMRMFNSDGSEAEMCGNAIRCVGKYAFERGLLEHEAITKQECTVETKGGIKILYFALKTDNKTVDTISVDMGIPTFLAHEIPVAISSETCFNHALEVLGTTYTLSCVSVGNPHAVIFVDNVEGFDLETVGPIIENHELFPRRINVEFVQVLDRSRVRMRVWERGAGETEACGTGACATAIICAKLGHTDKKVEVILNGGSLEIEMKDDHHVFMTGDAHIVFEGEYNEG